MDSCRRQLHTSLSSFLGSASHPPVQGTSRPSPDPVVSGIPKPQVAWFLEGVPMRRREGTVEIYEDGGSHYLCLLRARARDSGSYSCIASNVRGQVSCDWTLLVKSECIPPGSLGSAGKRGTSHPAQGHLPQPPPRASNPADIVPTCMPRPKSLLQDSGPDLKFITITSE